MIIKVLGTGCKKCEQLYQNVRSAVLGDDIAVEKVNDLMAIANFGVMSTPALVIDGKVKSVGQVLTVDQIKNLIQ